MRIKKEACNCEACHYAAIFFPVPGVLAINERGRSICNL